MKRKLKRHDRKREVKNIGACNSILILSSLREDKNAVMTLALSREFLAMNKEVFTLIYQGEKEEGDFSQITDIKVINKTHFNQFMIPKETHLNELIGREFDLLIDLSLSEQFPLKYIHSMSRAKFKSGAARDYKTVYGDVLIEVGNNEEVSYLAGQIKHYLTNINTHKQYVA